MKPVHTGVIFGCRTPECICVRGRSIQRSAVTLSVRAFAVLCVIWMQTVRADCDPKFGDELLRWVKDDAARQSWALASADYSSRTFNSMLLGYDDLHIGITQLSSDLGEIAETGRSFEAKLVDRDATSAAIGRVANAQLLLDRLISAKAKTAALRDDFAKVSKVPDRTAFILAGLYHVGVDTLLESFSQMGDASKHYLPSRYGVRVRVIYDGDGNYKGTEFDVPKSNDYEGASVTIVYALAQTYPWARYLLYAYAIFKGGQAIDSEQACLRRIAEQKDKVH